jgi:hypothetical protein
MDLKSSNAVMRCLAVAVLVAATPASVMHGADTGGAAVEGPTAGNVASAAPVILAQGRCFNGRCY